MFIQILMCSALLLKNLGADDTQEYMLHAILEQNKYYNSNCYNFQIRDKFNNATIFYTA